MDSLVVLLRQIALDLSEKLAGPLPKSEVGSFMPPPGTDIYASFRAGWNWAVLDRHPLTAEAQELLEQDVRIVPLFKPNTDTWLSCPLGESGIGVGTLLHGLFEAAAFEILALQLPGGASALPDRVEAGFRRICDIAKGKPVSVHTVVAFGGVEIPAGTDISLPWGSLRSTEPHVGPTRMVSNRSATVAISAAQTHRLHVRHAPSGWRPRLINEPLLAAASRFPLSVLLSGIPSAGVPYLAWQLTLLPCTWSPPVIGRQATPGRGIPPGWTRRQLAKVVRMAQLVEERYSPSLDIPVQRTLSALGDRTEDADRLIDALIAWESLVGTGQEITYRVTGALATLLVPRIDDRIACQKKLRELYGLRSRLVHGEGVKPAALRTGSDLALQVAIDALKAVILRRPDLIPLPSEQRSDSLLLGRRQS